MVESWPGYAWSLHYTFGREYKDSWLIDNSFKQLRDKRHHHLHEFFERAEEIARNKPKTVKPVGSKLSHYSTLEK